MQDNEVRHQYTIPRVSLIVVDAAIVEVCRAVFGGYSGAIDSRCADAVAKRFEG